VNDVVVQARGLTRRFGRFTAVKDATFEIRGGEIFGFLGANGAGKTTTIRMLSGLLRPSSGFGRVGPYDIRREPEKVKGLIGYMSQRFSLYLDLTAWENLEFYAGVYRLTRSQLAERGEKLLKLLDLEEMKGLVTGEMPLGWRQRLALACAIIHRPAVIFLDEPTAGVDPLNRRRFWGIINNLAESGSTVIVTTHYLDEAEYCHRLLIMHEGRIIATGSPGQLKARMNLKTMEDVFISLVGGAVNRDRKQ